SAIRAAPPFTRSRTHSAPVRVLPKPRPASSSHTAQDPTGASWFARAQKRHSRASLSASAGLSVARIFFRSDAGSNAIDSASEAFDGVIGGVLIALLVLDVELSLQTGARHYQIRDAAQ